MPGILASLAGIASVQAIILFVVAMAFAWNLGVHYTGAVMGMPYAARAIALKPALILISVFTIIGATLASGRVEETVGRHIISDRAVTIPDAIIIVLAAGSLTLIYNYRRVPTSTIQILVFSVAGVGLGGNVPIYWNTIADLAVVWVLAPVVAFALGFVFTRLLDHVIAPADARVELSAQDTQPETKGAAKSLSRWFPGVARAMRSPASKTHAGGTQTAISAWRLAPGLLVLVGICASFTLGANDVSNATGPLVLTHLLSPMLAGFFGGLGMAAGVLIWGRRILHTVAFDVVKMDLNMASAAQGVQALVVLVAATQGYFTSMNQALIGAMAGTGMARGRETVQRRQMLGILRGWLIGPISGLALGFVLSWLLHLITH